MKKIEELTLREKVGQMIIMRIQGKEIGPEEIDMIKNYKIGGIILYRKNYDTYEEMINIVNTITKINKDNNNIPLMISIDQEGGRVNRMPQEIKKMKSAGEIASLGDMEAIKKSGSIIAKTLRQSGIHMDFAPVLDIQRFEDKHAIGDRCYGKNADEVSENGITIMKCLSEEQIIPVVKHFPGHGSTNKDSHWNLPEINKCIEELENEDIVPFKNAIENNAEAIMIGHLKVNAMDKKFPASLSKKIIQGYLQKELNYKGLIITDDLKMRAICLKYGFAGAAVKACKAGNDIIMIGVQYHFVKRAIKKIEKKIKAGTIDEIDINNRVQKILKIKEKYNVNDEIASGCDINKINEDIILLNEKIDKSEKIKEL